MSSCSCTCALHPPDFGVFIVVFICHIRQLQQPAASLPVCCGALPLDLDAQLIGGDQLGFAHIKDRVSYCSVVGADRQTAMGMGGAAPTAAAALLSAAVQRRLHTSSGDSSFTCDRLQAGCCGLCWPLHELQAAEQLAEAALCPPHAVLLLPMPLVDVGAIFALQDAGGSGQM